MAKKKENFDRPNGFDSLSPFGENNDLKFRMKVESSQESYDSGVVGFQKTLKPFTKGKGSKVKSRRDS